ncbi:uncharacterized protein LOC123660397 [Melitaea cinxia]|uniref:uncharacterized protein LOC123660397 n=1 Tax=Melitaea cinxia TaxID=113334 RepID=UPI001E26EB31|nr:uncharacterized protein LOC123660397 [Melitaea cinxia]
MKERLILQDNNDKERRVNDNRESINFEETNRRVNIFDSRNNNDPRKFQRNWLRVRRSFIGRSLESDNERSTRDNLSMAHSQGRDQIRGSRKIRRNIDMSSDNILRRNRLTYSLVSKLSGTDETRRKLAYSRFLNENVIFGRRQPANRRDQNYDKILDIGNVRRSLGKQRRLREDENRMTTRKNIHVITSRRSILIDGTSTENVNYERSRSVRNRERSINNRLLTRKVDDERRKTKQSQEDRSFNTRRLDTINENRYSVTDFYGSESSRTHKTHYGSNVFEIKLQYLFYALQFAYLLSVLMQIPKINEKNKQRNRILAWLTPAEYIKID